MLVISLSENYFSIVAGLVPAWNLVMVRIYLTIVAGWYVPQLVAYLLTLKLIRMMAESITSISINERRSENLYLDMDISREQENIPLCYRPLSPGFLFPSHLPKHLCHWHHMFPHLCSCMHVHLYISTKWHAVLLLEWEGKCAQRNPSWWGRGWSPAPQK